MYKTMTTTIERDVELPNSSPPAIFEPAGIMELPAMFWRQKLVVVLSICTGLMLSAAYTALQPVLYRSRASVLIEQYSKNMATPQDSGSVMSGDILKAQRLLAESRPVIVNAGKVSGETLRAGVSGDLPPGFECRIDGQLLYFYVQNEKPEHAAKLANAWATAYIDEMTKRTQAPALYAHELLTSSLPELKGNWIKKQDALNAFEKETSFDPKEFEQHPARRRYDELNKALNSKNMALAALQAEEQVCKNASSPLDWLQLPRAKEDHNVAACLKQVEERRGRLLDTMEKFRPQSAEVKEVEEGVAAAKRDLQNAAERLMRQVQLELLTVKSERDQLQQLYNKAEQEVEELRSKSARHRVMTAEVQMAERLYTEMAQRVNETDLAGRYDFSYARPWEQADVSTAPYSPNWKRNMTAGLFMSLLLALGLVVGLRRAA